LDWDKKEIPRKRDVKKETNYRQRTNYLSENTGIEFQEYPANIQKNRIQFIIVIDPVFVIESVDSHQIA